MRGVTPIRRNHDDTIGVGSSAAAPRTCEDGEAGLNATTAICVGIGIGLALCAVALMGMMLMLRMRDSRSPAHAGSPASGQPPQAATPARPRATAPVTRSVPLVRRPATSALASALEGHLRNAILNADARERLVKDAMRHTGGDRAAAVRKVLEDLHSENKRWS
jgi:hypothetical protein